MTSFNLVSALFFIVVFQRTVKSNWSCTALQSCRDGAMPCQHAHSHASVRFAKHRCEQKQDMQMYGWGSTAEGMQGWQQAMVHASSIADISGDCL